MRIKVYLSGEIHSSWRQELKDLCGEQGVDPIFFEPVTDHSASDDVGVKILGAEEKPFWKDHKAAKINAIRTKTYIKSSDLVIVRFGDKYRQWNAAFEAGYAAALGKPIIVQHAPELTHALKEIDAEAMAVVETNQQVADIISYVVGEN